jgi:hypothetical protein
VRSETCGEALAHWSYFGRESLPSLTRVQADDWKTNSFEHRVHRSAWRLQIPPFQLGRLLNSFRPVAMEDKWFVYTDGPDDAGYARLHLHRSWTGSKVVELEIQTTGDEEEESEA